MVLFAIPLVAIKRFGVKAPIWLKVAAVSGFVVSVVAGIFTLVPITPVDSRLLFALKILIVVVAANAIELRSTVCVSRRNKLTSDCWDRRRPALQMSAKREKNADSTLKTSELTARCGGTPAVPPNHLTG